MDLFNSLVFLIPIPVQYLPPVDPKPLTLKFSKDSKDTDDSQNNPCIVLLSLMGSWLGPRSYGLCSMLLSQGLGISTDVRAMALHGLVIFYLGILWYPIMENQMEKKMENEMETGII